MDFGAAGQDAAPVYRLLGLDEPDLTMRSDPVLFTSNRGEWLKLAFFHPHSGLRSEQNRWAAHNVKCRICAKIRVADVHMVLTTH